MLKHSGPVHGRRRIAAVLAITTMAIAASLMAVVAPAGAASQSVVLVSDTTPGTTGGGATNMINVNGTLFFRASNGAGVNGSEIWKSDGTTAGTMMVKDINVGTGSSLSGNNIANVNGTFFFTATDGTGTTVWKSDGTPGGTVKVGAGIVTPSTGALFTPIGSTLYFIGTGVVAPTGGVELWKTDGITTVMVKDINATSTTASSSPNSLANINGTLYFAANDGVVGVEPWISDGTPTGTVLLKDINPTPGTSSTTNSSASQFISYNGSVFFTATNGSTANGNEIWVTDGTTAGTLMLVDLVPGTSGSSAGPLYNVNGLLVFPAFTAATGFEMFSSNGTGAGTGLVTEIVPGSGTGFGGFYAKAGNVVYIQASDGITGNELWRSDGTAAGTFLTKDIVSGTGGSIAGNFANGDLSGTLYFSAGPSTDKELWKSDGTTAGTVQVYDLVPGTAAGSNPTNMVAVAGTLFLQATVAATTGAELHRVNNGPTAVSDGSYSTNEDAPLTVNAPGLLANDTDPDGFPGGSLSATKVTDPTHGSVTVNGDGSFTYTPASNYNGPDSFTYKASDGSADSNVATVNLTVTPAADAPVAVDDSYSTGQNTSLTVTAPGVLGNDTDPDGDPLTAGSASVPLHGAVALSGNGGFNYIPNNNYTGPDSFTYVVSDGLGGTDTGEVNITISAAAISASPSTVTAGSPVTATWSGVGNPSATDWVGLYASSSAPDPALLAWSFTGGAAAGNLNLTVPAGATAATTYELRLYANNTYNRIATSAPFEVTAAAVSTTSISASPGSVSAGGPVTATWSDIASPSAIDWVGLYDSGAAPDAGVLAWAYTGGAAAGNLNLTVPAGAAPGAAYELRLFANNTYTRLATSASFTVTASATTISASPATVNAGGQVTGTWAGIASPSATDWVGLYASSSASDPALLAWAYTDGNVAGALNLIVPVGAASGATYELRLFSSNTYTRLATSNSFTVNASVATVSGTSPVAQGGTITATWSSIGVPSGTDWIGLYANSTDPDTAIVGEAIVGPPAYTLESWSYTTGAASGSLNLTVPASAPTGTTYELRLFSNNTYTRLATSAPITVTTP